MRISISTIGTRGEVQPVLALARQLQSLGHTPVLCVPPNFKEWVESFGIECVPVGIDVRQHMAKAATVKRKPTKTEMRGLVQWSVREFFTKLQAASRGGDLVVVAGGIQVAGRTIAESMDVPYVYAAFCPVTLPSDRHPPPMIRAQTLPRFVNRLLWLKQGNWNRTFGAVLNEERARLGLGMVRDVQRHVLTDRPWLAADAALAPFEGSARVEQTGAWLLDDAAALPDDLERFLADGEPPIYFGLGSMTASAETARLFVSAARALGRRAVLLKGWAELELDDLRADCTLIGDVSHQTLFPRVAAIVHHGGAGTTTAAARAGRPQVVIPHLYDQHYHAHRVRELGIGERGPAIKELTLPRLIGALRECLNLETAGRAEAFAPRIRRDGARLAAERLVAVARSRQPAL
jgi:vancomycin aglycone glucosyltransferase